MTETLKKKTMQSTEIYTISFSLMVHDDRRLTRQVLIIITSFSTKQESYLEDKMLNSIQLVSKKKILKEKSYYLHKDLQNQMKN